MINSYTVNTNKSFGKYQVVYVFLLEKWLQQIWKKSLNVAQPEFCEKKIENKVRLFFCLCNPLLQC